ncbi:alpha/beta-hydrolase [Aspergillus tamarii]|uniref:Carboxylic ester hydrolase n=1 Tax=Aspergillus tamarii TaxID=41984 RepID=A0A5N6V414_ASPTM|nr:alpha/beta-hydrolase [Aspergillus tamarii]
MHTGIGKKFLVLLYASASFALANPTVTIPSGTIVGTTLAPQNQPTVTAKANAYLGVPFAKSPPERFKPPEKPEAWTTPLKAQEYKPACIQHDPGNSEDCLYLNVYTPPDASPSNKKSVMFWIHGGNLQNGSAVMPVYSGSSLAVNEDVIVVTINYRLSIFGFSNAFKLPKGERNVGFLDQRLALDWVHHNIEYFGGEPANVTLFGESAGGYSVKQLLANPPSPLPFRAAILQSQQTLFFGEAHWSWLRALKHLNCFDLACVKRRSWEDIKDVIESEKIGFRPENDGVTSYDDIRESIETGKFANVPLMLGTNKDEGTVFVKPILDQLVTDLIFTCPTARIADYAAKRDHKIWRYRYSGVFSNITPFPHAGAWHGVEIPEVFGTYPLENEKGKATEEQVELSAYMQHVWASFAKDPSAGPGWAKVGKYPWNRVMADFGNRGSTNHKMIPSWKTDHACEVLYKLSKDLPTRFWW